MEQVGTASGGHPSLNLTPEEKRVYGQLFKEADPDGFGAVSGDVAVKFFERTRLPPDVLGQIWQIADTENRGFLTPAGFGVVLRLIGHAQAGRAPSTTIAPSPAPLPKFEGGAPTVQRQPTVQPPPPVAQPIVQQNSGTPSSPTSGPPPVRIPALGPDKVAEYSTLFDKSGAENGLLSGLVAKQIFERARLPNEVLGRIWNLADVQGKGSLEVHEFVIAMHLLASFKSGAMRGVPNVLPPGLLDAASRRPPARLGGPQRPSSAAGLPVQPLPQQFTGQLGRPQSPIVRQQMGTPLSAQSTGDAWLINAADKQRFDQVFSTMDTAGQGFISGEQAVQFFGNARLPEEVLAQIWDLADINSDGVLNKDEFAVAMFLIRQQRGSRDGRVPQTLPAGLVPPSMRKQQMPSQPSTMPAFDDAPVTKPRSAADDLFGLDVSEHPAPQPKPQPPQQVAQSTGGTDAGPFASSRAAPGPSSSPPPAAPSSTFFQPFNPASSWGRGMMPGAPSGQGQQRSQPDKDLMDGDDDEAPAKINNDAAELGNLSNQVGNLSKQMTDLQGQRGQAEQELTQTANNKRIFQERLTQLRAAYDQEVKQVKSLKDQLTTSQAETKRLQQDMAMIDGTHADLKTQHQQLSSALQADQQENASLKEKIRQTNAENEQLKPMLEKLKSDARQQKGLVAINKKQLATNESERDRIKAEIAAAQKELEDSHREAEETARQIEASQRELEQAKATPMPAPVPREISPPPQVVSPTPSVGSMNPFFRNQDGAVFSPPMGSAVTSPVPDHDRNAAFDSIFGPSFGTAAPAPATSFGRDLEPEPRSETPKVVEPPAPEPANQIDSSVLPLRQLSQDEGSTTSSVKVALPASRLSPAHTPRALTPDTSTASPSSHKADDPFVSSTVDEQQESVRQTLPRGDTSEKLGSIPGGFPSESRSSTPALNPTPVAIGAGAATLAAGAGLAAVATSQADSDKGKAPAEPTSNDDFDNFFAAPSHKKTLSEQRADFDSAFEGFDKPVKSSTSPAPPAPPAATRSEFPDIQELDDDDESSDESEEDAKGFDDDFAAPVPSAPLSSNVAGKQPEPASAVPSRLQAPPLESRVSSSSSLPGIESQQPPPDYQDAVPNDNPNHFPPEFKNLLPEREDPTSPPPTAGGSALPGQNPAGSPPSYGPEVGQSRSVSHSEAEAPPPTSGAPFDFDSAFQGLGQAPVAADDESDSDYDDRTPGALKHQPQSFDFDPSFDSPANSTKTTSTAPKPFSIHDAVTSPTTNGTTDSPISPRDPNAFSNFDEFNSNPFPPSRTGTLQSQSQPAAAPPPATATSPSHDWDALFAPLNAPPNASAPQTTGGPGPASPPIVDDSMGAPLNRVDTSHSVQQSTQIGHDLTATTTHEEIEELTPPASQQRVPTMNAMPTSPPPTQSNAGMSRLAPKVERPKPGRALTEGTEHDDPILKSLTAMGWSRNESLAALEKFDYNIDKAADYLTFKS